MSVRRVWTHVVCGRQLQMFPPDFKFPCTVDAPGCATNGVPPAPESKYPEADPDSGAYGLPIGIEGRSSTASTVQQLQQVRAHDYTHACTCLDMCVVMCLDMGTDKCFGMCSVSACVAAWALPERDRTVLFVHAHMSIR